SAANKAATVAENLFVNGPIPGPAPEPPVGSVTATLAGALVNDDADAKLDPTNGNPVTTEKVTYTATLGNTTNTNATGVTFSDTIDSHTTLVANSINSSPLAVNDGSYNATTNVAFNVAAAGVLANDFDPDNDLNTALSIVSHGASTGNEQTSI